MSLRRAGRHFSWQPTCCSSFLLPCRRQGPVILRLVHRAALHQCHRPPDVTSRAADRALSRGRHGAEQLERLLREFQSAAGHLTTIEPIQWLTHQQLQRASSEAGPSRTEHLDQCQPAAGGCHHHAMHRSPSRGVSWTIPCSVLPWRMRWIPSIARDKRFLTVENHRGRKDLRLQMVARQETRDLPFHSCTQL